MTNLKEIDVVDDHDNIVISPDLKVRHKDSQYEYTVDSVVNDDQGEVLILLRLPDEPRAGLDKVDSPEPDLMRDMSSGKVLYEVDPSLQVYEPEEDDVEDTEQDLLAVPRQEFEKEYEVK